VNREKALVWDAKTQRVYQINDQRVWRDRQDEYGGRDIVSQFHHKADHAVQGQHVASVHQETHDYFKPYDVAKAGTPGYDANGYPNGMEVIQQVHLNESEVYAARTVNLPIDGDIVYQERLEGRSIQTRVTIRKAPWWYTGFETDVDTIDKQTRPSQRQMTEGEWMDELGQWPLFHVSRSYRCPLNLATGEAPSGTVDMRVTGPDGMAESAMAFAAGSAGLSDTLPARLDENFTAALWYTDAPLALLPIRLWRVGALAISIQASGTTHQLVVSSGPGISSSVDLSGNGTGWQLITVVRDGLYFRLYEGVNLLSNVPLDAVVDFGTTLNRCGGDGYSLFDAWIVPRAVSIEALRYYHTQVLRGGNQVLPIF
jgi:hypothetical protein